MSRLVDEQQPWPGLLPYDEASKDYFFGRENETEEFVRLIDRETLTVLFGQSGLGKSSLLLAGVFPRLRHTGYLPVYLRLNLDGAAPPLMEQVWQTLGDECVQRGIAAAARQPNDSFWQYLHRVDTDWTVHGQSVTPVLVFDQFEELFTHGRKTALQKQNSQHLLQELGDLIENRLPPALETLLTEQPQRINDYDLLRQNLKIVFTFREDYLPDFEGLKSIIRPIMHNRMRLVRMTGQRAAKAIHQAGNQLVDNETVDRIVRYVGEAPRDGASSLEQYLVEPALLSLFCSRLNEQRRLRNEKTIHPDLIQGDNPEKIFEDFYNEGFAGLPTPVRYFVEDHLLTRAGHRDSCALENALDQLDVSEPILQTLEERRIVRREERSGHIRLELIHDRLAKVAKHSRDLRRQIEEQKQAKSAAFRKIRNLSIFSGLMAALFVLMTAVAWGMFRARQEIIERDKKIAELSGPRARKIDEKLTMQQISEIKAKAKNKYKIFDETMDKHPVLVDLILMTDSMDDKERQYWFNTLPSMTDVQITKLFDILETERVKLKDLEKRYAEEIEFANKKSNQSISLCNSLIESAESNYKKKSADGYFEAIKVAGQALDCISRLGNTPHVEKRQAELYNLISQSYGFIDQKKYIETIIENKSKAIEIYGALVSSNEENKILAFLLGGQSYNKILTGEYLSALESANSALTLSPNEIWIKTNQAHALLFLGHVDEAQKIYRDNWNAKINDKQTFGEAVLDDFEAFRKARLPEGPMQNIEKFFGGRNRKSVKLRDDMRDLR